MSYLSLIVEPVVVPPSALPFLPRVLPRLRPSALRFCVALLFAAFFFLSCLSSAVAQQNAAEEAARRQKVLNELPPDAARVLFGTTAAPAPLEARAIGAYGRGCLAGATALPADGSAWQAMRLSRNRNWGHPVLIRWIEKFADASAKDGWPGLLVGDIAQPRGGPMLTGHASHQLGLEVDIWLTPMPKERRLSKEEREEISAVNMVRDDWLDVDPSRFSSSHIQLLKRAASDPQVDRIFVNAAIKKALCREVSGDRRWLAKIRPWQGHNYHFHVRHKCPKGDACGVKELGARDEGCGKELDYWFSDAVLKPKPPQPGAKPAPKPRPWTLADLPEACRKVVIAR